MGGGQPVTPSPLHLLVADPAYPRLKDFLIGATGLAYYADKDDDLAGRIAQRLARLGLPDCASYLTNLSSTAGEGELDALIEDLTIGETFFFRHREMFDALRDVILPECIARNQHSRQLRIWSAGCSTGAEPYSVSILLRRDLGHLIQGWDVTIIGTDINRDFLARARAGCFEEWAFRGTPGELRRDCFTSSGTSWLLAPQFKQDVTFQYHNLVTHPFPSLLNNLFAFDVILCRNVAIYFSQPIVRRIVDHFCQSLVENGWLLVGHAEPNIETFAAFRTVNAPGAVLYQKTSVDNPTARFVDLPPAQLPVAWLHPTESGPAHVGPPEPHEPAATPNSPPASATGPPQLVEIRALADRGEWEKAVNCCQQAVETDKLNPAVHFFHALILEQSGHHADAEQALRRSIYLDRAFCLAHYYLGLLLLKQGRLRPAARSFQNVLELLGRVDTNHVFTDGDGITAAELVKLTQMHLRVLNEA
jgi:chemotaxis protein methyltransferase CheR